MTPLWIFMAILAALFLVKLVYVISLVVALPRTGGALFCTTQMNKIERVLEVLPLSPGQNVIDLGCGDGRFLKAAVKRCGVQARGYEINLLACLLARLRLLGERRVRVLRRDFWSADLGEADLVFCYLFPDVMPRLAEKARCELKPGALLVSCNFPLPGWEAETILTAAPPTAQDPIYVYQGASIRKMTVKIPSTAGASQFKPVR